MDFVSHLDSQNAGFHSLAWLVDLLCADGSGCRQGPRFKVEISNAENFMIKNLGGGFKYFFCFHPYLGKISILTNIFQRG